MAEHYPKLDGSADIQRSQGWMEKTATGASFCVEGLGSRLQGPGSMVVVVRVFADKNK